MLSYVSLIHSKKSISAGISIVQTNSYIDPFGLVTAQTDRKLGTNDLEVTGVQSENLTTSLGTHNNPNAPFRPKKQTPSHGKQVIFMLSLQLHSRLAVTGTGTGYGARTSGMITGYL